MEENRLQPMRENYDPQIFNDYYKRTEGLRRKLASEIDCSRFGVDKEEILSWFDVKFIYVFNKYYDSKRETLLGYLVNSLKTFKYRVLRAAYTKKYSGTTIDIEDLGNYEYLSVPPDEPDNKGLFHDLAFSFMEKHLSENAFELLNCQLYPPPYILRRLDELGIKSHNKIPSSILAEYLELGNSPKAIRYVDSLKEEINNATKKAREFFRLNPMKHSIG